MSQIASQTPVAAQPTKFENGRQVAAPSGVNIAGVVWREYQVKSAAEDGKTQKVVGTVVCPEFDEKNVEAGMQQIAAYPWGNEELNGGVSYPNWAAAVISLVNTQHTTNIRNRMRSASSGKMTQQEIRVEAINRMQQMEPDAMKAAMQQGGMAMFQLMEKYEKIVKDEYNKKKAPQTNDVEAIDAAARADQASATQPATVPQQ